MIIAASKKKLMYYQISYIKVVSLSGENFSPAAIAPVRFTYLSL